MGTEALNVRIREERPADVAAIDAVTVAAFLNAPHTDHTEQFIVRALREAGALSVSLVAEVDGESLADIVPPNRCAQAAWIGVPSPIMARSSATGKRYRRVAQTAARKHSRSREQ